MAVRPRSRDRAPDRARTRDVDVRRRTGCAPAARAALDVGPGLASVRGRPVRRCGRRSPRHGTRARPSPRSGNPRSSRGRRPGRARRRRAGGPARPRSGCGRRTARPPRPPAPRAARRARVGVGAVEGVLDSGPPAAPVPSASAAQVPWVRAAEETRRGWARGPGGQPLPRARAPRAPRGRSAGGGGPRPRRARPCRGASTTSRRRCPRRGRIGRRRAHSANVHPLGFLSCQWVPRASRPRAPGDLLVIGGAEDKLGKRTVLREFVERAGGAEARIAVVPTASSLGPEIVDVYAALFTRLGAAEVYGVRPTDRGPGLRPDAGGRARPGHRHLHDRRQPAQAVHRHRRHAVRPGDRRRPRARRDRSPAPRPGRASSPRTWSPSAPAAPRPSSG